MFGIAAGGTIESRREQRELVGSVMAKFAAMAGKPCQAASGASCQYEGLVASWSVATLSQATSCTAPSRATSGIATRSGTNGSKNQRRSVRVSFSSNSRRTARIFLRSSMPSLMVSSPQHFAGAALHHLRADIERGEQRIERRGRGVLHEAFVEAAVLNRRFWPRMWRSLMWICDACEKLAQLLVGRLCRDDARRIGAKLGEPHGETPGIEWMKLHEAGPGLVEQM